MNRFKRKRSRHAIPNLPKGLQFLTKEMKIKPKIVKAIIKPFCEQLQRELDAKLLDKIANTRPIIPGDVSTYPTVRAVNIDEEEIDLVKWLNEVYAGLRFASNELIQHHEQILDNHSLTNHELWQKVAIILIAEFKWSSKQSMDYKPNMEDLIFRHKSDFYGGVWNAFGDNWQEFIDLLDDEELKDELKETLKFGVDTSSFSRKKTEKDGAIFRSKSKPVVTVPVFNEDYRRQFRGRHPDKRKLKFKYKRVRRGLKLDVMEPALLGRPVAHRPLLLKDKKKGVLPGIFKTSKKSLDCQETICDKLLEWIEMRAIEYVGRKTDLHEGQRLDLVNTFLPMVVEMFKPRLCLDGGPHLAVAQKTKLPCELDTITMLMNNLKQGDYMAKCDDKNGFMHIDLDNVAKPQHGFVFGDLVFRAKALPFGLRVVF